jgi:hypothetical protein
MNKLLAFFVLVIVLIFGFLYFLFMTTPQEAPGTNTVVVVDNSPKLINRITLVCNLGATIEASFYERTATTTVPVGQPPVPTGSVKLELSDGRTFDLPQTISADGGRYANAGEIFVFWSKGNGALVLENGAEKKYRGCVQVAEVDAQVKLPSVFADKEGTFSLRLPGIFSSTTSGFKIEEPFTRVLTPKKSIDGVRFTIPASMATGTNLSRDSYLSIEHIASSTACSAKMFFDGVSNASSFTDGGVTYSVATSSEAAAGNRYEEVVYGVQGTNPCVGVRYFVHYGVFENYASGTVTAYNKNALIASFDQIRRTLMVNQ